MSGDDDSEKEKVVTFDRSRRRPDAARVREFAETARKLQRERNGSVEAVARRLAETPRDEWARLAEDPEMRTSGALEQLGARIRAMCERDPKETLALSTLATTIAETLPPDAYPPVILAQLRAHAWKDRAHTLRFLGEFEQALEAADTAAKKLDPFPATAHDRAVVSLVKASTLQQMERFDESRVILAECSAVFRDHGDSRLYLYCGLMEGNLFYRQQRFAEACEIWKPLLKVAFESADFETAARLHNNIGCCNVHLGAFSEANMHLSQAKAMFVDLGKPVEALRTDQGYGMLLVAKGQVDDGVAVLHRTRAGYLAHGLVEDAGLCGLAVAQALAPRDHDAADTMLRDIVGEFTAAEVNPSAIEAVAFLQRAMKVSVPSAATFRHVETFIKSLRRNPGLAFAMPA